VPALPEIDEQLILEYLDDLTVERGRRYFDDGHVVSTAWNSQANVLTGRVAGTRSTPYAVTVIFAPGTRTGRRTGVLATSCSCPMSSACKHVAALLFASRDQVRQHAPVEPPTSAPPTWLTRLAPVTRRPDAPRGRPETRTLGLQLRVVPPAAPTRYQQQRTGPGLHARPVVRGRRDRWVQGGLTWANLGYAYDAGTTDQRTAVRQLLALHSLDFPYGVRDAWLPLERINAPLLWEALEGIRHAGVALVLDDREQAPVTLLSEKAVVAVDIRKVDPESETSGLEVTVPVTVADATAEPDHLGFLGRPAHGVFLWQTPPGNDDGEPTAVRLPPLAEPVDDALAALALQPPVSVPPGDVEAFTVQALPALRAEHPVVSRDGSYALPEPPHPVLELRVQHFGQAKAELTWGWRYVNPGGDADRSPRVPLQPGRDDDPLVRRDVATEADILLSLEWLIRDFPHLGVPTATGHRLASIGILVGLPMLGFVRDALPRLLADERLLVTVSGSPLDYREADEAPAITMTAVPRAASRDWLDLSVTVTVDGQEVPFDELLRALTAGEEILILASGTYLRLDQPDLQRLRALVEEARSLAEHTRDGLGVSRYHVDLWAELERLGVIDTQEQAWRQALASLATEGSIPGRPLSPRVHATLRGYQTDGYAWLAHLRESGLGGVLADDMGLGKTLQAIALIADARENGTGPWLVVAPASVVHNWSAEIARFAPSLTVVPVMETTKRRGSGIVTDAEDADVVVVSYTLFRIDIDEFASRSWGGLILDEAQFVKNRQSQGYACARRLDAPVKFAITGTPMENNLMELWSLLSITAPGLFPNPKRFAEFYQRPIEREGDDERLALLRRRIRPFLLRRTKEEVAAELPAKVEQVLELDLHPRHRRIYDTRLQRERQKVLGLLGDMDANRIQIFQSLTMLRQLSLDASLVDDAHAGIPSAKLDALLEMLDDVVAEGHRVLVFSQFTRYLALAKSRLESAGIRYAYLDGRTRNRGRVIEEFRTGSVPVFLISLKAGGFGLNLTEADYVVLLDPWWNPATEAQAVDRAHRIGQDRQVMVYRLVSRDTIEEKVMALKAEKAALFAGVLSDSAARGTGLTADDIRDLLG
jgi:superfamily II DNA or RNA helicase